MSGNESLKQAAILLFGMGEEHAAEVLKHLNQGQVEKLITHMHNLGNIHEKDVVMALNHFFTDSKESTGLDVKSDQYIRGTLVSAVGSEKANSIIDKAHIGQKAKGLEILSWQSPEIIYDLLYEEHPQLIALGLTHVSSEKAAAVISKLTKEIRLNVMERLTKIDVVSPIALEEVAKVFEQHLTEVKTFTHLTTSGIETTADIVNYLDSEFEKEVLSTISETDSDLADKIQDKMFPFEKLATIDDRGLQTLLREIDNEDLILALKGVDPDVKESLFKNMSERAAEMLKDDLEAKGPVQLAKVQAAQKKIVKKAQEMAKAGTIVIAIGGDSDMVF